MSLEYTLDAEDVAAARLLAIGIRPPVEFTGFVAAVIVELALSVSVLHFALLPLLIGLTASLAGFRLIQINKVKQESAAAYRRNHTLRSVTVATWDADGITIQPAAALSERILWTALRPVKENDRVILFHQTSGQIHALPKRAFSDKKALAAFRRLARTRTSRARA